MNATEQMSILEEASRLTAENSLLKAYIDNINLRAALEDSKLSLPKLLAPQEPKDAQVLYLAPRLRGESHDN